MKRARESTDSTEEEAKAGAAHAPSTPSLSADRAGAGAGVETASVALLGLVKSSLAVPTTSSLYALHERVQECLPQGTGFRLLAGGRYADVTLGRKPNLTSLVW